MLMKKKAVIGVCICVFVCFLVSLLLFLAHKPQKSRSEYLIDIIIQNNQNIEIDYIEMGIVLPEGEEVINRRELGSDSESVHFTISYSSDTQFFLSGKTTDQKDIKPCYFNLAGYENTEEEQEKYFYIEDYEIFEDGK